MYRMISLAAVLACACLQACATSHPRVSAAPDEARNQAHPAFAVIKSALPESSAAPVGAISRRFRSKRTLLTYKVIL